MNGILTRTDTWTNTKSATYHHFVAVHAHGVRGQLLRQVIVRAEHQFPLVGECVVAPELLEHLALYIFPHRCVAPEAEQIGAVTYDAVAATRPRVHVDALVEHAVGFVVDGLHFEWLEFVRLVSGMPAAFFRRGAFHWMAVCVICDHICRSGATWILLVCARLRGRCNGGAGGPMIDVERNV